MRRKHRIKKNKNAHAFVSWYFLVLFHDAVDLQAGKALRALSRNKAGRREDLVLVMMCRPQFLVTVRGGRDS